MMRRLASNAAAFVAAKTLRAQWWALEARRGGMAGLDRAVAWDPVVGWLLVGLSMVLPDAVRYGVLCEGLEGPAQAVSLWVFAKKERE